MIAKYRDPFDETLLVDDAGCNRLPIAVNQSVDAESQTRAEKGSRQVFFSYQEQCTKYIFCSVTRTDTYPPSFRMELMEKNRNFSLFNAPRADLEKPFISLSSRVAHMINGTFPRMKAKFSNFHPA